ncbi:CrcB family protein [Polymorphospora sp. NPDC050346]|uniref:fluoride efflux transporter FluC n=1 Tax=Polymorphospora sp. NPDC050346 TaxID=3155780 RepID=UPI0034100C5B
MTLLLVLAGGALGAVCRFLVGQAVTGRLPWGTFGVNVVGSALLGLVAGAGSALPGWIGPLVGTGFCGALTTYSAFAYETVDLASGRHSRLRAVGYVAGTLLVGLAATAVGWLAGDRFLGGTPI